MVPSERVHEEQKALTGWYKEGKTLRQDNDLAFKEKSLNDGDDMVSIHVKEEGRNSDGEGEYRVVQRGTGEEDRGK